MQLRPVTPREAQEGRQRGSQAQTISWSFLGILMLPLASSTRTSSTGPALACTFPVESARLSGETYDENTGYINTVAAVATAQPSLLSSSRRDVPRTKGRARPRTRQLPGHWQASWQRGEWLSGGAGRARGGQLTGPSARQTDANGTAEPADPRPCTWRRGRV